MMKKNKIILILMSIVVLVATAGIGAGFIRKSEKNKLISCEHIDSDVDMICDLCSEKLPFSNYVEYDEIESAQTSTNEKVQVTGVLIKNSQVEVAKLNKEDAVSLAQSYKKDILPEQVVDAFDIDVTNESLKYQPTAYGQKVKVKLSNLDMNLDIDDSKTYALMHIMDNENYEILPIDRLTAEEIEFTTGSFSTYIIITVNTRKITFDGENYKVFDTNGEEIVGNTTVAQGTALNFNIVPNNNYGIASIESTLASGDSAITTLGNVRGKVCNISSVDEDITITVTTVLAPSITTQPTTQKVIVGNTATFKVVAENATTYQWQYRENENTYWKNVSSSSTSATLSVSTYSVMEEYTYRCLVGNTYFTEEQRISSDIAALSLTPATSISVGEIPIIMEQPTLDLTKVKVQSGTAKFSVVAMGTNLTFTWQYRESENDYWKDTTSTQGSSSTSTPSNSTTEKPLKKSTFTTKTRLYSNTDYQYRCLVGNNYYKEHDAVKSDIVTVSLAEGDISIKAAKFELEYTKQPETQKINYGEKATFEITAKGANKYQWQYKSGDNIYWEDVTSSIATGYNTAKLTMDTSKITSGDCADGFELRCVIWNSSIADYKKTSDVAALSVVQPIETESVYAEVKGELMARENYDYIDGRHVYYVLGAQRANKKDYASDKITKIIFTNTIPSNVTVSWDVSAESVAGTITSYLVPSVVKDGMQYYDQYIVSNSEIKVTSGRNLFRNYTNVTEIEGIELLDTSEVTDMCLMFCDCSSLTELDLGEMFDTSNVTTMYGMFNECSSLRKLNLGEKFDTSNVTDMSYLFNKCNSLAKLNSGENFDTSNVTDMSHMFYECSSLTELHFGEKFDTSKVRDMSYMFFNCRSLTELNLGEKFNTSNVTNMSYMFFNCRLLTELNLGEKFNTSNVTNMTNMFNSCSSLETLVLPSGFDRLIGEEMFRDMTNLTRIISLRRAHSQSYLMEVSSDTGIENTKAILYVAPQVAKAFYEITYWGPILGVGRIKPILELVGSDSVSTVENATYVDQGVTIAGWTNEETSKYQNIGLTCTATGLPVDTSIVGTKTITYNLQYTDSKDTTLTLDTLTRTVKVNAAPQLMEREDADYIDGEYVYYALGAKRANEKDYTADKITKIIFTNTVPANVTAKWDVSAENAAGTVISYLVPSVVKDGTQYYDQYIVAKSEIKVTSGENLFKKYTKITEIKGMELLDTKDVTNMFGMFYDCDSLTNLNLGENFNTSNVTDMYGMFEECKSLTELNLGKNFDTSNVSDMYGMFGECKSLVELNLGDKFDTSNVVDMSYMFRDCWDLTELNLGKNFNTSNVVNMHAMFGGCSSLIELNLGEKFDTSKVEDMNYMFCSCYVLTQLNLGQNFDTSNVTGMDEMFSLCYSLTKLNLGENFDTSNVTDMYEMFYGCYSLEQLNLGDKFDTSNVEDMNCMFNLCCTLTQLNLGKKFDTSNVTDMYSMFSECYSLTELNLGEKFNTNNVADMSYMFAYCTSLEIIQLGKDFAWLDKGQFEDCDSLKAIITERQITSSSDAIKLPANTGLKELPNAILYVLDPVSETNYENAENYASELGVDRIRPILELQGEEYVVIKPGEIYTESGATVAGLTVVNSNIYTGLGYTLSSTSTVKENVSGRYEVIWTVYKPTGNALMSVKRDVYVRYIPTVPTITVTQGATQISSGNWANGNVVVTIGGSEYTEGAIEYIYSINGSEWATGNTFNYEQETLSTIIRVKARGVADNEDISSEATFELKLDKTIPEIVTHERIRYDGVNEVISLVTYDGGISSGIEVYAISATNDISTATWQTRNELLIPENGTWYTWVRDNAGNVSEVYTLTANEKITVEVTSDGKIEYYSDVYKAIETLNNKGVAIATIKLLESNIISSDFEKSVIKEIVIYADYEYILDLNGKELVCTDGIVVRGKLTIDNSDETMSYVKHEIGLVTTSTISVEGELIIDGNVQIESASNAGHAIEVVANGKADLRNGKVISNNSEATIHNLGTLTLGKEDNTVSVEAPYVKGTNKVIDNDATLNIYDGKLVSISKETTLDGKATTLQPGYHLVEKETETTKEMYLETNDTWIEYWDISETAGVDNVYAGIKIVEGDGITDNTRYKLVVGGTGKAKSFVLEYSNDKILTDIPWFDKYSETIVELDLEEGVTRYGDYTFYRLINVESLKLPDSLEAIGASAFAKMRALKGNVNIPKNVTTIANDNPFYDTMLTSFTVDAENTRFKVVNDTLYGGNKLIAYPTARTNATTTVIDGTVSIGVSAFAKNQYLKTVTLPDTLEIIDWGAFETTAIEEITIPSSVKKIQGHAFIYCRSLKAVYLKSTELGESSSKSRFIDLARNSIIYTESKAVADLLTPDVEYTAERTKVYYPFEITTTLADAEIARGDTLHFEVEVIDGYIADDVVYQWYKDGVAIPGANSLSYTKTSFTNADEGMYKLVVRSAYQSNGTYYYTVESNEATISLGDFEAPEEVNSSVNYNEDGTATITVTGKDKETGVNEIIVNGNPIEIEKNTETGAATGKFDISKSGDYTVEVKDYEGNTTTITITAYEIHYKPNALTYTGETNYQIKIKDTDIRVRANGFEKAGHSFTSWNTKEDNTGKTYKANDLYTGNEDMTLYATWNVLEYVVRFYNDNGINGEQLVSEATYPYGATITVPEEQYKTATEIEGDKYRIYYHKDNWTAVRTDANSKEKPVNITSKNKDTITMVDSNVNYYASYTYKDYSTKQSTLKVDGKTQITGNEVGIINNEGLVIIGENSTQTSTPTITGNTSIQNNNGIVMWYQANFIGPTQGLLVH